MASRKKRFFCPNESPWEHAENVSIEPNRAGQRKWPPRSQPAELAAVCLLFLSYLLFLS